MSKSNFKRDIFFKIEDTLREQNVAFLLGPRKCGKTYALMQLSEEFNYEYIDFKTLRNEQEIIDCLDRIISDIENGNDKVYLLDEVTNLSMAEAEIARIASAFTKAKTNGVEQKTKIVFAGSQSVVLEAWGRRAFCNQAKFINTNFLSYSEWLSFANRTDDVSEESFLDFIHGVFKFYNTFDSIEEYLKGCLDETIISNSNSRNFVYGTDCDLVEIEVLIDILYITMFHLHDRTSASTFFKKGSFEEKLGYLLRTKEYKGKLSLDELRERFENSFLYKYDHVQSVSLDALKQSYSFLIRCGLITATPISQEFNTSVSVLSNLENPDGIYKDKASLFRSVNFTITYPMFYVELLREVFKEELPHDIGGYTLGSLVECTVRGILPSGSGVYEYHENGGTQKEIDYINIRKHLTVEISISNKDVNKDVNFSIIPEQETYHKVLLTESISDNYNGITRIPYYVFIYNNKSDDGDPNLSLVAEITDRSSSKMNDGINYSELANSIQSLADTTEQYVVSETVPVINDDIDI